MTVIGAHFRIIAIVSQCRPEASEPSPVAPKSSPPVCLLGQKSRLDCGTTQLRPIYSLVAFTKPQKSSGSLQMPTNTESSCPHIQDQFFRKHSSALELCSWLRNLTNSLSVGLEKSNNPREVLQEWRQTWFRVLDHWNSESSALSFFPCCHCTSQTLFSSFSW